MAGHRQRLASSISACGAAFALMASAPGPAAAAEEALAAELKRLRAQIEAQEARLNAAQNMIAQQAARLERQDRWLAAQDDVIARQVGEYETPDGRVTTYTQTVPAVLRAARFKGFAEAGEADGRPRVERVQAQAGPSGYGRAPAAQGGSGGQGGDADSAARPRSQRATDQLLLDAGGVLLPKGTLQIEPSLDFTNISSDRVNINGFTIFNALVVGEITVDDINREILTSNLALRYGIMRRLQGEVRFPVQYRNDYEILQVGTNAQLEQQIDNFDWSDIEATLAWQPWAQKDWRPAAILRWRLRAPTGVSPFQVPLIDIIGPQVDNNGNPIVDPDTGETLTRVVDRRLAESPTGSGFWASGPAATFVWRSDPVVFFAGGGYTANFNRSFGSDAEGKTRINPGDTADVFTGFNLALSERVSVNTAFSMQRTFESFANNARLPGTATTDARLAFGASVGLTEHLSLVMQASAGLTDESPDFSYTISLPITFNQLFGS